MSFSSRESMDGNWFSRHTWTVHHHNWSRKAVWPSGQAFNKISISTSIVVPHIARSTDGRWHGDTSCIQGGRGQDQGRFWVVLSYDLENYLYMCGKSSQIISCDVMNLWWNRYRINMPNVTMWRNSYQNSWMIKKKHTEKCVYIHTRNIYILIRIHFLFGIFQPSCIIGSPGRVKSAGETALYEDLDAWALPAFPPVKFWNSSPKKKRTIPKRNVVLKKCPFYRVYVKLWG